MNEAANRPPFLFMRAPNGGALRLAGWHLAALKHGDEKSRSRQSRSYQAALYGSACQIEYRLCTAGSGLSLLMRSLRFNGLIRIRETSPCPYASTLMLSAQKPPPGSR